MMIWSEPSGGQGSVTVTVATRGDLISDLSRCIEASKGFAVATLNLDHVVKLARDPLFRTAYCAHTHVTADGNPIVWLSRLAGQSDVRLVPGSEAIAPLVTLAAEKNVPVALIGSTQSSLAAAAKALLAENPSLKIALSLAPSNNFDPEGDEAQEILSQLADSGAQMVFLALGAPKQERFAAKAHAALPTVGFVSIGAGLDFISGEQRRAPAFVRAVAAEWIWRLLSNPSRLAARYALCFTILPKLTLRALFIRFGLRK